MTDTKKPTTTVAQDVAAFRAVVDGKHLTTETPADVLADIRRKIESIRNTTSLGYQTGPYAYAGEDMGQYLRDATDDCRDILHSLSTLERSLAAGKVVYLVPAGIVHEGRETYTRHDVCPPMSDAERLYTAPPADPAKASEPDLHPKTADLVNRFARALAEKLAAAEKKYGYSDGWSDPGWLDECRAHLIAHVHKGDPRDVAAYCAFLWHHGSHADPRSPFCEKCGSAEECDCTTTAKASGSAPDGWTVRWQKEDDDSLLLISHPEHGGVGVFKGDETPRVTTGPMLYELAKDLMTATPPASAPEVTDSVRERIDEIANNLGETINHGCDQDAVNRINGYIDQLFALTAALQQEGKSHG